MSVRNYPVPRSVAFSATPRISRDRLLDDAVAAAAAGRVRGHHLPVLASGGWAAGAEWAGSVLERERSAKKRRAETLLAAIGYDPETYMYQGVLDPGYPDQELIVSVTRSSGPDSELERWDGVDWGTAEVGEDGVQYLVLDEDVLADVLSALSDGSAGMFLRPFEPKAWVDRSACPAPYSIVSAGAPHHTGCMVALPLSPELASQLAVEGGEAPEDLHVTLAYLGDTTEDDIDYEALQRAVAKWSRRVGRIEGGVSGPGRFDEGEEPVSVALVDAPALPEYRQMLVHALESEGLTVRKDHGYTPHITLAYDNRDLGELPSLRGDLNWDHATVHYADDVQTYELGTPVRAAAGVSPDIVYAIVDEFDTSAVLDLVQVRPGPTAYRRVGGKWIADRDVLLRLMGIDPPPVVELDPDQVDDVVAQVDSYDRENPEPVTAAIPWDEDKYKRGGGGRFASKPGSTTKATTTRGPKRPGGGADSAGGKLGSERVERIGWDDVVNEPWKLAGKLDSLGLGPDFWGKQPPGFRKWLEKFLADEAARHAPRGSSSSNTDGDDDRTDAQREADKKVQAENQARNEETIRKGGKDEASGQPSWWDRVPAEYRAAMRSFLRAAAANVGRADRVQANAERRVAALDRADREFDLEFAKEGLGESRRREVFDRQILDLQERLTRAGVDPKGAQAVIAQKVLAEKRKRQEFERKRKLRAEQERIRRMEQAGAEKDEQDRALAAAGDKPATSQMDSGLKKYWVHGEGGAKIRWGTGGDFDRCRRALAKYLRPDQISGACANLHRLATGKWPGKGREH